MIGSKWLRIVAAAFVAASFTAAPIFSSADATTGSIINVSITPGAAAKTDDAYGPNPVQVSLGDTVVWTNNDSTVHTAVSGTASDGPTGVFGPALIVPAGKQNFTFTEAGEFPYFCVLHPTMVGTIIVGGTVGLTVKTDKSIYDFEDNVRIIGKVADIQENLPVTLRVAYANGTLVRIDQVTVDSDGSYNYNFPIGGVLFEQNKSYTVTSLYGDLTASTSFRIGSSSVESCLGLAPTIVGTERNDVLNGTSGDDVIVGVRGNDTINGLGGDDTICGGLGLDELSGGDGDDRIFGGNGNDAISGDFGHDSLWGGQGWDRLFGGPDKDILHGGVGNDFLEGGDGDDKLFGQEGDDILDGIPENDNLGEFDILVDVEAQFEPGADVAIFGTVDDPDVGFDEVTVSIIYPDGNEEEEEVELDGDGEFDFDYALAYNAKDGVYTVQVSYRGDSAFSYFLVDDEVDAIFVEADDVYEPNDVVRIFGEAAEPSAEGGLVSITVLGPNGIVVDDVLADGDADSFEFEFELDGSVGRYAVLAIGDDGEGFRTFEVSEGGGSGFDNVVEIDDITPGPGDEITISGVIDGAEEDEDVDITIREPGNGGTDNADTQIVSDDGDFSESYEIPDPTDDGIYQVEVEFGTEDSMFAYFLIDEDDDDVPTVTDEDTYEQGQDVEISGEVLDPVTGEEEVDIIVLDPEGNDIGPGSVDLDSDDDFEGTVELDNNAHAGIYAVIVEYDGNEAGWFIFEVEEGSGSDSSEITALLADASLSPGDEVVITGSINENDIDIDEVILTVEDPDNAEIENDSVRPDNAGGFEFRFDLDDNADIGTYIVTLQYVDYDDKTLAFTVSKSSSGGGSSGGGSGFTARLSTTSALAGELLTVRGVVEEIVLDEPVNIVILGPDGRFTGVSSFPEPGSDRSYSSLLSLPINLPEDDDYQVIVSYYGNEIELHFDVTGKTSSVEVITVMTDRTSYSAESTIRITGKIADNAIEPGQQVLVQIFNPKNTPYRFDPITPDSSGTYSYSLVVGGLLGIEGEWHVKVTYARQIAETTFQLT
jgi:plastocyanin